MIIGLLLGLCFGFAVLNRPTTIFFLIATFLSLLIGRSGWKIAGMMLGGLVPAGILFHFNWSHFHNLLLSGYVDDDWTTTPPWHVGLLGLLVAPSRGMFIYSPALLLMLPAIGQLLRKDTEPAVTRHRALILLWTLAGVAQLIFFARWHDCAADGAWTAVPLRGHADLLPPVLPSRMHD